MDPTARVYLKICCKSSYIKVVFDAAWRVISMLGSPRAEYPNCANQTRGDCMEECRFHDRKAWSAK